MAQPGSQALGRVVAPFQAAIVVGGDESDRVRARSWDGFGHKLCSLGGERAQAAFLPGGDETPRRIVVDDGGSGGRERNSTPGTFAAAVDRPRGRRAAPPAERSGDADEPRAATRAERLSRLAARGAAHRNDEVEERRGPAHATRVRAALPRAGDFFAPEQTKGRCCGPSSQGGVMRGIVWPSGGLVAAGQPLEEAATFPEPVLELFALVHLVGEEDYLRRR